jgi:hypothetical protein
MEARLTVVAGHMALLADRAGSRHVLARRTAGRMAAAAAGRSLAAVAVGDMRFAADSRLGRTAAGARHIGLGARSPVEERRTGWGTGCIDRKVPTCCL